MLIKVQSKTHIVRKKEIKALINKRVSLKFSENKSKFSFLAFLQIF